MEEERRPMDPTRRLLRVFGVTVTNYDEKTSALLEQARQTTSPEELLSLAAEAIDLTLELNQRLRETSDHILETQARVLGELKTALQPLED